MEGCGMSRNPKLAPPNISWTAEEALEADKLAGSPFSKSDPTGPFGQWCGLNMLEEQRQLFENGDRFALMLAIRVCANHDLPLPEWVSRAYIRAFDRVLNYHSKSWDEVFGNPVPKGVHLSALRKRRKLMFGVFNRVHGLLSASPDMPIDEALFEKVGKEFNIGHSLASEYYYAAKRLLPPISRN